MNRPRENFIVTNQSREDRQTRGVRRGPPGRPKRVRIQIEDRARASLPARGLRSGVPHLIKDAVVGIYGNRMTVAGALTAPLDRRVKRNCVGSGIAFVRVGKGGRV